MADDQADSPALLSNHAHVLLSIAADPEMRLRDIADALDVTERTVVGIVGELEDAGFLTRQRVGRRNQYIVHPEVALVDPHLGHHVAGELIGAMSHRSDTEPPPRPPVPRPGRVNLDVADPERSAAFYASFFAFDGDRRTLPTGAVVVTSQDGFELALRPAGPFTTPTTGVQLGLPCSSRRAAVDLIDWLLGAGVPATDRHESTTSVSATFTDPDGHDVGVYWRE
ncbi:MAG: MarR family winged helix-turn-helix transcriptional regulator [Acidimicrobiales bacterium]